MTSFSAPGVDKNRQWRLKQLIEKRELVGTEHFAWTEAPRPTVRSGEILLRTLCLGTSPAQRSYVTRSVSMHDKVAAGEVMRGRGVAVVAQSRNPAFTEGDWYTATTGWQDFSCHDPDHPGLYGIDKVGFSDLPSALALGVLGAAGVTAYFGLKDVGAIQPGQTVLISAAAGGVGSCAVQIARHRGCRVVGIAGGEQKCRWVREVLGADSAIDYKSSDLAGALDEACPDGIDVFFDNVGGEQLELALERLAIGARVVICGYIATDYATSFPGPRNYIYLLRRRARMEGFFVFDYKERFQQAQARLREWYLDGILKDTTDRLIGLEQMPEALRSLFVGTNQGVRVCQVAPDGAWAD